MVWQGYATGETLGREAETRAKQIKSVYKDVKNVRHLSLPT